MRMHTPSGLQRYKAANFNHVHLNDRPIFVKGGCWINQPAFQWKRVWGGTQTAPVSSSLV